MQIVNYFFVEKMCQKQLCLKLIWSFLLPAEQSSEAAYI